MSMYNQEFKDAFEKFLVMKNKTFALANETMFQPEHILNELPWGKLKLANIQINIIYTLAQQKKPMTVGELAKLQAVFPQSISKPVIDLAKKGIVRRFQDENDFRQVYVELTPYGEELRQEQNSLKLNYLLSKVAPVTTLEELQKLTEFLDFFLNFLNRLKNHDATLKKSVSSAKKSEDVLQQQQL